MSFKETAIFTPIKIRLKELKLMLMVCIAANILYLGLLLYAFLNMNFFFISLMIFYFTILIFSITQFYWFRRLKKGTYKPHLTYETTRNFYRDDYVFSIREKRFILKYIEAIYYEIDGDCTYILVKSSMKNELFCLYNFDMTLTNEGFKEMKSIFTKQGMEHTKFIQK